MEEASWCLAITGRTLDAKMTLIPRAELLGRLSRNDQCQDEEFDRSKEDALQKDRHKTYWKEQRHIAVLSDLCSKT